MLIPDMATGQVSIDLGAKGPMVQLLLLAQQVQILSVKHLKSFKEVLLML